MPHPQDMGASRHHDGGGQRGRNTQSPVLTPCGEPGGLSCGGDLGTENVEEGEGLSPAQPGKVNLLRLFIATQPIIITLGGLKQLFYLFFIIFLNFILFLNFT